ncbi:MAG: 16S rRNA (cytosine(967)-C(5))-methyltransferase RsmB [Proteobacteria bacterium]|nr:16S rRNA (cytosine(967)-C(5))-methyltransferase RsmB [Pseudomonadota bacterium]
MSQDKPNPSHPTVATDGGMQPPRRKNKRPPRFEHEKNRHNPVEKATAEREKTQAPAGKPKSERGRREPERREPERRKGTQNPRELVVETLMRIEEGGYSNIVWDIALKRSDLSSLDKMLATRIFYGTLSNMRLIDSLWASIEPEMLKRADAVVKMTLRSAMYQLVFLDRVPAYSIVSTSVDLVKRLRNRAASGYCNALLRKAVARQESPRGLKFEPTGNRLNDFAVQYSLNDDLAKLLLDEFGEDADVIAQSMLSVPRMMLRINESRTTLEKFMSMKNINVERSTLLPETSCAVQARQDMLDDALEQGYVCVQDEAAQLAVCALGNPETWGVGQKEVHIWDACAGQGGKSIHILDEIATSDKSRKYTLLSTDLYANKLSRLKDYQQKFFSEQHLITRERDLTQPGSVPLAPFDVILVDAPCSGLGVLRRHPEVKLTRTAEDIQSLVSLQKEILDNVCRHLRVGGILVYAVCTITKEECEQQVEKFLQAHPNFEADVLPAPCTANHEPASQIRFMPHIDGCDGFFIARFVRKT